MRHFAANYVFNGESFIRNSCISFDEKGYLFCVGSENSGLVERERMIFYNGILCPNFVASIPKSDIPVQGFLKSLNLNFTRQTRLPIILLENIDLLTLRFTDISIAKEIL